MAQTPANQAWEQQRLDQLQRTTEADPGNKPPNRDASIPAGDRAGLIFLEMFKANRFQDLFLSEWVRNTRPELVMQHLGLSQETLRAIPAKKVGLMPA
jgi:oxalate decarboxylase